MSEKPAENHCNKQGKKRERRGVNSRTSEGSIPPGRTGLKSKNLSVTWERCKRKGRRKNKSRGEKQKGEPACIGQLLKDSRLKRDERQKIFLKAQKTPHQKYGTLRPSNSSNVIEDSRTTFPTYETTKGRGRREKTLLTNT